MIGWIIPFAVLYVFQIISVVSILLFDKGREFLPTQVAVLWWIVPFLPVLVAIARRVRQLPTFRRDDWEGL